MAAAQLTRKVKRYVSLTIIHFMKIGKSI